MEENILICEDTLEGIFTAIYTAYERHCIPEKTAIQVSEEENLRLFASYEYVKNDREKSEKVIRTLKRRFGEEGFQTFCFALSSENKEKATVVYRTIARGLLLPYPQQIFGRYAIREVGMLEKLRLNTWNEYHHLLGFLRFQELERGILFSEIKPKNHVLLFLAQHFADRLPEEHFLIYDVKRQLFAVHEAGKQWFLTDSPGIGDTWRAESGAESEYQELFRYFCHKITINQRKNEELQKGLLPLRFRPYMTEFKKT